MLFTQVAFLSVIASAPLPSDAGNEIRVAFEKKLVGEWINGGPCIGDITIRADKTFERRHHSPGNHTLSGTWKLKWDAQAPMLVLTCEKSNSNFNIGKIAEVKVTRLDDKEMHWEADGHSVGRYKRKND